jgi:uncharacterized protein (DUF58 family)
MLRLLLILATALVIIELSASRPIDQATVAVAIAALLAFIWSRLSVRRLTLVREPLVDHVAVGERFEEQLSLINASWLPKPWLEVFDYSTLPGHGAGQVVRVRGQGSVRWRARSVCTHRGEYELGPIRVRSGDPFGLFSRTVIAPETISVLIWPLSAYLPAFNEPGGIFAGGPKVGWSPFTSPSVSGVRTYTPGDPFNRIAWNATARTSTLMVKELEQDPTSDVWIVLDLQRQVHVDAPGPVRHVPPDAPESLLHSTTEYGVAVAASIGRTYLERGRSVGVILSGFHQAVLSPDRGDAHLARIMDHLAVVQADGEMPLDQVLRAHETRFNRQASVVVISCALDEGWSGELGRLAGLGIPAQAVVLQPESFGSPSSSLPLIGALIAANVPVTTVAHGDRLESISNSEALLGDSYAAG